jgi:hypothetical protein
MEEAKENGGGRDREMMKQEKIEEDKELKKLMKNGAGREKEKIKQGK